MFDKYIATYQNKKYRYIGTQLRYLLYLPVSGYTRLVHVHDDDWHDGCLQVQVGDDHLRHQLHQTHD